MAYDDSGVAYDDSGVTYPWAGAENESPEYPDWGLQTVVYWVVHTGEHCTSVPVLHTLEYFTLHSEVAPWSHTVL